MHGKVLAALAVASRRRLYERLRRQDYSVGELAKSSRMTQPAVSQHLRVLKDARLVTSRREGTRSYYRANQEGLAALRRYVESMWDDVLAAFAADDPNPPMQQQVPGRKPRRRTR